MLLIQQLVSEAMRWNIKVPLYQIMQTFGTEISGELPEIISFKTSDKVNFLYEQLAIRAYQYDTTIMDILSFWRGNGSVKLQARNAFRPGIGKKTSNNKES